MNMVRRRVLLGGAVLSLIALGVACGSPTPKGATTPASSGASPAATTTVDATGTAIFEGINRKRVENHAPTLAPGIDARTPFPLPTSDPNAAIPNGPSATPEHPSCGSTIAGWPEIATQYSVDSKSNRCFILGTQLVIALVGRPPRGIGAVATYQCEATDTSCLKGDPPTAVGARWSVYPAPFQGGLPIVQFNPPDTVVTLQGYCFNLTTHTYDLNKICGRP